MTFEHKELTSEIIGSAFEVYNQLGYGFLEKVYQRAMQVELKLRGIHAELEKSIKVNYKEFLVGEYFADILVEDKVLVELKVSPSYCSRDEAQLLNELKATNFKVGLLVNFGKEKVEFNRFVY